MSQSQQDISLLTFQVGPYRFCVNAVEAESIIAKPQIRSIPGMRGSVAGVFSHRGNVIVVVNLRIKLGLQEFASKKSGQLITASINGEPKGFWVDEVLDLQHNADLLWQRVPAFRKQTIVDQIVLKDNTVLLHTDFERLFYAEDSEALVDGFSEKVADLCTARDHECDQSSQCRKISEDSGSITPPEDPLPSPGEETADAGRSEKPEASEKEHSAPVDISGVPAFEGENDRSGYRNSAGTITGNPCFQKQSAAAESQRPVIRLYSGPNNHRSNFQKVRPGRFKTQRPACRVHNQRTDKRKNRSKMLIAGLAAMVIAGVITVLFWPENQQSEDARLISIVHAGEQRRKPIDTKENPSLPLDDYEHTLLSDLKNRQADEMAYLASASPRIDSAKNTVPDEESENSAGSPQIDSEVSISPSSRDEAIDGQEHNLETVGSSFSNGWDVKEAIQSAPSGQDKAGGEASPNIEGLRSEGGEDTSAGSIVAAGAMYSPTAEPPQTDNPAAYPAAAAPELLEEAEQPESADSSPKISEEILRIETDNFTLTIERPENPPVRQTPSKPSPVLSEERLIHIVVRGDTLWDIAGNYLGNPFRYPELAELSHIKDPHWIYPGDVITIVRKKTPGKLVE